MGVTKAKNAKITKNHTLKLSSPISSGPKANDRPNLTRKNTARNNWVNAV